MKRRSAGLFLLLSASLAFGEEPIRLVAGELKAVNVEPKLAAFLSDHLAQQLALQPGFKVTTQEQVGAVLGLERQKQLLGCSETGCTAEMLGALGSDVLLMGGVAKVGERYQVNLKAVGARSAEALSLVSASCDGEDGLIRLLSESAPTLAADIRKAMGRAIVVSTSSGPRAKVWVPAAAGVALALGGGTFLLMARGQETRLLENDPSIVSRKDYLDAVETGKSQQTVGTVLLVAGAAGLVIAGAIFALDKGSAPTATLVPIPGGAALSLGGAF